MGFLDSSSGRSILTAGFGGQLFAQLFARPPVDLRVVYLVRAISIGEIFRKQKTENRVSEKWLVYGAMTDVEELTEFPD